MNRFQIDVNRLFDDSLVGQFLTAMQRNSSEIFMFNIALGVDRYQVMEEISKFVHSPAYSGFNRERILNFDVFLHPQKRARDTAWSSRTGCLTFPSQDVTDRFLSDFRSNRIEVTLGGRSIGFKPSNRAAKAHILDRIRKHPFVDPIVLKRRAAMGRLFEQSVNLSAVQFGWDCRDEVFSIEWERAARASSPHHLRFNGIQREMELCLEHGISTSLTSKEYIIVPFSFVYAAHVDDAITPPSLQLKLRYPPTFVAEVDTFEDGKSVRKRTRLPHLQDDANARVVPYTSTSLRLVCESDADLKTFQRLYRIFVHRRDLTVSNVGVEMRNLFSSSVLEELTSWLRHLPWPVAFHVHSLVTNWIMDPTELLPLRRQVQTLIEDEGCDFVIAFLRQFGVELNNLWYSDSAQSYESTGVCFQRVLGGRLEVHRKDPVTVLSKERLDDLFECLHVTVSPSRLKLEGPYPERHNRVTRQYKDYQSYFLRVSFVDENNFHYRFDRSVDGDPLIRQRVGGHLHNGITIGGRLFDFLAYSQSALKEHAVWFVTPFTDITSGTLVSAITIIESIGQFAGSRHDEKLIFCPARYAARISQAFTAIDTFVAIEAGEVVEEPDVKRDGHCFTDGVGTMSREFATDASHAIRNRRGRGELSGDETPFPAFQIRYQGCKGMVSIDYTLIGRKLVLRPSMIKFDAFNAREVGIAAYFPKPSKLFLNRPLIVLLEGLGVSPKTFLSLQRAAVQDAREAVETLQGSAKLLEKYGLGSSFRLPSILTALSSLGVTKSDDFQSLKGSMRIALFHILRELKHRCRIPVTGYTLVGVADIHEFLKQDEVFVCVEEQGEIWYLEGDVLVTRSPVIHPGDVQMAKAIGPPPSNSPFINETFRNCVVFSVLGPRPLPSCLGGGDLDGDVYNVSDLKELHPSRTEEAAEYAPAQRKTINRHSTISDIADFVVDFILSDNLGIIAKSWLITADESPQGIMDKKCIELAQLHSDAVDYPKTGTSVPREKIPKVDYTYLPDWLLPEVSTRPEEYYTSNKALGQLFRDIELSEYDSQSEADDAIEYVVTAEEHAMFMPRELESTIYKTVCRSVRKAIGRDTQKPPTMAFFEVTFNGFAEHLHDICVSHTLSHRHERLSETEAIIGVITKKTSQPRRRQQLMSKMREQTTQLVTDTRWSLKGNEENSNVDRLRLAAGAWELAWTKLGCDKFGARSFWWICLGVILEELKEIKEVPGRQYGMSAEEDEQESGEYEEHGGYEFPNTDYAYFDDGLE